MATLLSLKASLLYCSLNGSIAFRSPIDRKQSFRRFRVLIGSSTNMETFGGSPGISVVGSMTLKVVNIGVEGTGMVEFQVPK